MGRDEHESLNDLLRSTAERKRRAAQSRSRDRNEAENPRDVYLSCCEQIAREFSEGGFRYAKSGPHMSRRDSGFKFSVQFGSSRNNLANEFVQLDLAPFVDSSRLKKWRSEQTHASRPDGHVAGRSPHLLFGQPLPIRWNVADAETRRHTCDDVVDYVRQNLLPWFDLFRDVEGLLQRLVSEDLPGLTENVFGVVEFILCYGDRCAALGFCKRRMEQAEVSPAELEPTIATYRREGIPEVQAFGLTDHLARVALVHELLLD